MIVLLRPCFAALAGQFRVKLSHFWSDLQSHVENINTCNASFQELLFGNTWSRTMGKDSENRLSVDNPDSVETSQSETSIRPECLPEPLRGHLYGAGGMLKDSAWHPLMRLGRRTELTEEERRFLSELQTSIRICNRFVPELRIQMPDRNIPLNPKICADYYFKCQHAAFEKDGANKVAELLTSFLEQYPLEWRFSGWKNDLIAKLVLGELNTTSSAREEPGERWLKAHWKRERRMQRETATYLSPKRMAASSAVFELELLAIQDKNSFWIYPGFRGYATFVTWLNANWAQLASKKKGAALFSMIAREFRNKWPDLAFSDSDFEEICFAYHSIESSHPSGKVPPYQVVLTLVARKNGVSPRLVTKVRAESNKQRLARETNEKAPS
jgi:hypothetical protein